MGSMGGMGGMGDMGMDTHDDRYMRKGESMIHHYDISLLELYTGKLLKLASLATKICRHCKGTGGKQNAKPKSCAICAGKGYSINLIRLPQGMATQKEKCGHCHGSGNVYSTKDKCKKCKGACVLERHKVLEVEIPKGSRHQQKFVLEGEGDEQPGIEAGDIIVILNEVSHPTFTRTRNDLSARINITLAESLCGFSRTVLQHLDSSGIILNHDLSKGIIKPFDVLKIDSRGMPVLGDEEKFGDLYLTVEIEFPDERWLKRDGNIGKLRDLLPSPSPHNDFKGAERSHQLDFRICEKSKNARAAQDEADNEGDIPSCAQQ